jgi:hypothetical protein
MACSKSNFGLTILLNDSCSNWMIVSGGGNARHINGIQSLLIRQHFPGMVLHAGVRGPPYTWEHFSSVEDNEHGTLANRIKRKFWVSF